MIDRIEMSGKEIKRLEVLRQVADGITTQRAAGLVLELSERQVRRLLRSYERGGAPALVSRRRGRVSNRRFDAELKATVLARVSERYTDFGPTLAAEYLRSEGHVLSKETLRGWMIEAGLWRAARGRRQSLHPPRPRRSRQGELVQIDGSPHDWFEGRGPRCTLIAFIDDATSWVGVACFVPAETSEAYLNCLHTYVERYGCPVALYSDRHGIFTKHDPEDARPTQFQRALDSLDMTGILALTPQAKGRVERLFQTLQDRLVKALRLAGIDDMAAANAALPALLAAHNARFAVAPAEPADAHRAYLGEPAVLARSCARHETRKLSKDLVLSFRRQRYIIQTGGTPRYALRGATVTVITYADGRIELMHGQEQLPFRVFDEQGPDTSAVDDKTLNTRVDLAVARRGSEKSRPAPNHPWRRYPVVSPSSGAGQLASP